MKTILPLLRSWALVLLFGACFHTSAHATLIAHDPLYYDPDATWEERAGGVGWSQSWSGGLAIGTNGLVYPGLATSGRSFQMNAFGGSDHRFLDTTSFPALVTSSRFGRTNTVLWLSFLARRQPPIATRQSWEYFGVSLANAFSRRVLIGSPTASNSNWGLLVQNAGVPVVTNFSSRTINDGTTALLVVQLTFGPAGLNDSVALFVDPALGAPPTTPDAIITGLDFQFDGLEAEYSGSETRVAIDELRLGETFADVAPPGTAAPSAFSLTPLPETFSKEFVPILRTVAVVETLAAGRTVSLSITGAPPGSTFSPITGAFAWTPGELDGQTSHEIGFVAVDNSVPPQTNARVFRIYVEEDNIPPNVAWVGAVGVQAGQTLSLQLAATDADLPAQSVGYWLVDGPAGLTLSYDGQVAWTPSPQQTDILYPVHYNVSDNFDTFTQTFHIYARSVGGLISNAPPLRAFNLGTNLTLAWTNLPGSFAVQTTTNLVAAEWRTVTNATALANDQRWLTLAATNDLGFFRLRNLDAVRLTNAVPRGSSIPPGTNVFVDLRFTGDIGADDILEVTELGLNTANVRRIPGSALQGDQGIGFYLDADALPLPQASIVVRVLDSQGGRHGLSIFQVTNSAAQAVGSAPVLSSIRWLTTNGQVRLPSSDREVVTPPLVLTVADPDGDIVRFGLKTTDPLNETTSWELPVANLGTGPTNSVIFPLTFNRLSQQGTWQVEVVAIDAAGRRSQPRSTEIQILQFTQIGALQGPTVRYVDPTNGPAGSIVTLITEGLDLPALSNAVVRIGGRIATVVEAGTNLLSVLVPTDTAGGTVELQTPIGKTAAPRQFRVVPAVNVAPAVANALAGQSLQFGFDRRLPDDAVVTWSVVGAGTVNATGRFTAPSNLPFPTNALVRASVQVPGTNLISDAFVAIEAAAVPRGQATILAASGGVVWSEDLLARVEIPTGALPTNAAVSIRRRALVDLPPAASVPAFLGALELGPDGTVFNQPVTIHIPLTRSMTPGTSLSLRFWNGTSSTWMDEGVVAQVEPDGLRARAQITHFSIPGVFGGPTVSGPDPVITTVTPNQILEGDVRPILLEGSNLDGDITLEVRRPGGSWLPGLYNGPLVRGQGASPFSENGTRAAFLLDCPVMPDVAAGQSVPLEIRVRRGNGPWSSLPFAAVGLDEFNAATFSTGFPGQRLTNLFSEIVVDRSFFNLRHDVLDLQATRWVIVNREVNVSGRNGASPSGSAMVFGQGTGNRAGAGTAANGDFTATYELPASTMRIGFGGAHGAPARDLASLYALADCQDNAAEECFDEILRDLRDDPFDELEDAPDDLANLLARLPDGRRGSSGMWFGAASHWFALRTHAVISDNPRFLRGFGPGSGGGGGGNSGTLFGDPNSRQAGAGGGEGGGAVRFLSGRDVFLDATIRANGGLGGNGSMRSVAGYSLQGGGGGGGGAGAIRVMAGRTLHFTGTNALLQARGGRVGFGGIATRQENVGFGLWAEIPYSEDPETPVGMQVAEGARFDETALANGVVRSNVLTLVARRAPELWANDLTGAANLNPDRPHIVVRRADGSASRRCYFHPVGAPNSPAFRVNLVFFPGANVVELGRSDESLLNRHIVCLSGPDPDNDGLSTPDELALGTNPNATDSDGDTLGDLDELLTGGDPTSADSDGDLLRDDAEIAAGTFPTSVDSDGDGLWDSLELFLGRSPTEASPRDLHYAEGNVFVVADNARGEKILALLDPLSGRLGALGRVPGNRADGLTFDNRGTLYLAQGDALYEWAGSVPYERPAIAGGAASGGFVGRVSSGSPRHGGSVSVGMANVPPAPPTPPASRIADIRMVINAAGNAVFTKLGDIRSTNALGAFTLPVAAGPMTYDPMLGMFNRLHGVATAGGAAGNTFHLTNNNRFVPPVVNSFIPGSGVGHPVKALAFGKPTGYFALLAPPTGDVLQQINPYASGTSGNPFPLGRADALAMVHVNTNEFLLTTAARDVLRITLQPALSSLIATPLATTLAPCPLMAHVPCVDGCFNPNPVSGNGPLGSGFIARGFRQGDFNNDGFLDLAVCGESGQQARIHILHGDGAGHFTAVAEHSLGTGTIDANGKLAIGFANNDALTDLAVAWSAGSFSGQISILLGTADGRFAAPVASVPALRPSGIALGAFDGVVTDDLAFANNTAFLAHGNAAGSFNSVPTDSLTPVNLATRLVEFSDLNHDGKQDLIRFGEYVATHLGGSLSTTWSNVAGFGGADVMELGDWNGDGETDLFLSGYSGFITVMTGNGNGTFNPALSLLSGRLYGAYPKLAVGDLDLDGLADVALPDPYGRQLLLFGSSRPGGTLIQRAAIALPFFPVAARIADFNGDGLPDITVLGDTGAIQTILGR